MSGRSTFALASYAKQSDDDTLEKMAMGIRARAIQRCGQLLEQVAPAKGANNRYTKVEGDGNGPFYSRKDAAQEAGMSERQKKTALRVAKVPEEQFQKMAESDNPVTITELAAVQK